MVNSPLLKNIAIIGGGSIGQEYSRILSAHSVSHRIISRSSSIDEDLLIRQDVRDIPIDELNGFDGFIIAVQAGYNFEITKFILANTSTPVLVEKPLSLVQSDHLGLHDQFERIFIALNRRKFESVKALRNASEPRVRKSALAEVTELESRISGPDDVVAAWPIANTLHIIDMALYGANTYHYLDEGLVIEKGEGLIRGRVSTRDDTHEVLFLDFHKLTGNWGIEIASSEGRHILRPLETLQFQERDTFKRVSVDLPEDKFKPGFESNVVDFVAQNRSAFISFKEYDFLMELIAKLYDLNEASAAS